MCVGVGGGVWGRGVGGGHLKLDAHACGGHLKLDAHTPGGHLKLHAWCWCWCWCWWWWWWSLHVNVALPSPLICNLRAALSIKFETEHVSYDWCMMSVQTDMLHNIGFCINNEVSCIVDGYDVV